MTPPGHTYAWTDNLKMTPEALALKAECIYRAALSLQVVQLKTGQYSEVDW